ncbi:polysulfide reductase NrfD [Silvimonas sp. JCM 19000]
MALPDQPAVSRGTPELAPGYSAGSITDRIAHIVLHDPLGWRWTAVFGVASLGVLMFVVATAYLFAVGVGIWGVDMPVAWGFALTNFVWWIGIGHAGTFISAVLLLLRQKWRTSINRFAEAMTLFAASIAGLFPILHLGRPWFFYWLVPYPNKMTLWPQWRSPLIWDFFAISTYLTVSLLFWYVGLIPDLAALRDKTHNRRKQFWYGLFALGWRGETRQWVSFNRTYWLLAGLATPLVVSVHTIVAMDFAIGNTPGYHSTLFPPYFVAGALFSGFAMVITLAIPLRAAFKLQAFITPTHLANAAKVVLATGCIVGYGYITETFTAFYSGNEYERAMTLDRAIGTYAPLFWLMLLCNVAVPQLLWLRRVRHHIPALLTISILVNVGMWLERFIIVTQSLHRDFLPSSWGSYTPTRWDVMLYVGSIALFVFLFMLFIRFLPLISMAEMRELVQEEKQP